MPRRYWLMKCEPGRHRSGDASAGAAAGRDAGRPRAGRGSMAEMSVEYARLSATGV